MTKLALKNIFLVLIVLKGCYVQGQIRPQEPQEPYEYIVEEVNVVNKESGYLLASTLTIPAEKNKQYPAVILVSGTGPNDRNEEIKGHKPFHVIADYLTQHGYAVIRYDKRGVHKSTGVYETATVYDFTSDAEAVLGYLKSRSDIDPAKIGILGHSEGGEVAQIIASRDKSLDFIILLGSPGIQGSDLLVLQNDALSKVFGIADSIRSVERKQDMAAYQITIAHEDPIEGAKQLRTYYESVPLVERRSSTEIEQQIGMLTSAHYRNLLMFNPADYLSKIDCKVLALNGDKDLQVLAKENLEGIAQGLAHNRRVTLKSYKNYNHLFQYTKTGNPLEYGMLTETFSPKILRDIVKWLDREVK